MAGLLVAEGVFLVRFVRFGEGSGVVETAWTAVMFPPFPPPFPSPLPEVLAPLLGSGLELWALPSEDALLLPSALPACNVLESDRLLLPPLA